MTAIEQRVSQGRVRSRGRVPAALTEAARRPEQLVFGLPGAVGVVGMVVALLTLFVNGTDAVIAPLLSLLAVTLAAASGVKRARTTVLDRPIVIIAIASLVAALAVALIPVWMFGANINGIVHRTVVSGPLLLLLGTLTVVISLRRLLAASPSGQDAALAPVLLVAVFVGVAGYLVVLGKVILSGVATFRFELLTTAWHQNASSGGGFTYDVGFLNNILGTFLLIALTLLIAIVPGVGAGVFISEYPGRVARVINFCTTMLRAVALFIIGASAFGVAHLVQGVDSSNFLSQVVRGGFNDGTNIQPERGSFILAALALAMLVMPVFARLTEEGLRSVPREMREGTAALGATEGYGLRRILLPWASPNILTALILGGAEAAGGLAIVMFLAVPGQNGVGLFNGVTTLDYAVYAARYGPRQYWNVMQTYQFTAALLLLLLTVGLTLIAMAVQRRFAKRFRGSLTVQ